MVNKPPDQETAKFLKSIWENEKKDNKTAQWLPCIKTCEATNSHKPKMEKNY